MTDVDRPATPEWMPLERSMTETTMNPPPDGEAFFIDANGSDFAYRAPGSFPELMDADQMTWAFWIKTEGVSGRIGGVHGVGDPNRIWWFEADDSGRELQIVLFNPSAGGAGTGEPVFRVSQGAPFYQPGLFTRGRDREARVR